MARTPPDKLWQSESHNIFLCAIKTHIVWPWHFPWMVYGAVLAKMGAPGANRSGGPLLGVAAALVWYRIGKIPHNRGQS
jgi:hypothetical protein